MTLLGRWRRDRRGFLTVEFALILPLLLLLSAGVLETGLMLMTDGTLELAVRTASRIGLAGVTAPGKTRDQTIRDAIESVAGRWKGSGTLKIDTRVFVTFGDIGHPEPYTDKNGNNQYDSNEDFVDVNGNKSYDDGKGIPSVGNRGDTVIYTVTLTRPGFTGVLGLVGITTLTFSRKIAVENE